MRIDGSGGEPVADDDRKPARFAALAGQPGLRIRVKLAPEIRASEIVLAAGRPARNKYGFQTQVREALCQALGVEGRVNGVTGPRVIEGKFK